MNDNTSIYTSFEINSVVFTNIINPGIPILDEFPICRRDFLIIDFVHSSRMTQHYDYNTYLDDFRTFLSLTSYL